MILIRQFIRIRVIRNGLAGLIGILAVAGCVQPASTLPQRGPDTVPTYTPTTDTPVAPADDGGTSGGTLRPEPRPLTVALASGLPEQHTVPLLPLLMQMEPVATDQGTRAVQLLDRADLADVVVDLAPLLGGTDPWLTERIYAAVVPFATSTDATTLAELAARWRGEGAGLLVAPADAVADLSALFGGPAADATAFAQAGALLPALEGAPGAIGILPFDRIDPRFKVLAVDGVNVLDNRFNRETYPLAVGLVARGEEAAAVAAALAPSMASRTNRDPDKLTTLIMTGVTAMSRVTALRMEQNGYTYPAAVISATLRAADITHISNEVPFLDDCVVNAGVNNLILCSHTNYWATLEAVGTDIVGLSGNHVNDFGRDGARRSLEWYQENEIPIYGSGFTVSEACAPLFWEHNGNRFAFIAALAFYPQSAWATEDQPGACYYFDNKEQILDQIAALRDEADIISVELQHTETYEPFPIAEQVADFRELRQAGADIVTGVQSHVPQAMEPYGPEPGRDPSIIVYGLGNLFFDQMWSWQTRTELMARHAIYDGRLLNTEILTAVLEDYAQPRWATEAERTEILERIFNAAPPRPQPVAP